MVITAAKRYITKLQLILICFIIIILLSCPFEVRESGAQEVLVKGKTITLAWDPPLTDLLDDPLEVAKYYIYYREIGEYWWTFLSETERSLHPQYTIDIEIIGPGKFVFGIRAICVNGAASPIHSSYDYTAEPPTGWYVFWIGSK